MGLASRAIHAERAASMAREPLLGEDVHLFESPAIRDAWADLVGDVSASHHWEIRKVERKLGTRGAIPFADVGPIDLGYIACILRIVDFAHISFERATYLDRALRSDVSAESVIHWDAQAKIQGPEREGNELAYASNSRLANVDAWWLFFEMARGLQAEIRMVRQYLDSRAVSKGRFSLEGVRGTFDAEAFSHFVQLPDSIVPIDIKVQPSSVDRLVSILGGSSLYGNDQLAPIRELVQNARDAISLRLLMMASDADDFTGRINVRMFDRRGQTYLEISDNGVGMDRHVLCHHLIGIASDYWRSEEFFRDYAEARRRGFNPAGRFGIGFLSVFMLGDAVSVETERQV